MDDRTETHGHLVKAGQAREVDTAFPVTVKIRAYLSSNHLWAARYLSVLAGKIEKTSAERLRCDIKHRAYVTNSIFSAVGFLEGAINELYQDVADSHESYVANLDGDSTRLMSDFWRDTNEGRSCSALIKYQIVLTFLRKPQFERGRSPYQDAALVVKLRNELVHYKPKTLGGDLEHPLAGELQNKFEGNALMTGSGNPWFPGKCLGHGCAEWAVRSVIAFADDFFGRIGVQPNYQRAQFQPSPDEA